MEGRENSSARSMEATDTSRLGVSSWFRIKNTHSLTHAAHPRSEEGEQERGRYLCDLICEQATAECTKIQMPAVACKTIPR